MKLNATGKPDSKVTVLVIDDEKYLREMIRTFLELDFANTKVEVAADGLEAGRKMRSLRPGLVIMDVMLPGMDGYKLCQVIRESPKLKHARIISITGVVQPEVRERLLSLGANDFLAKPFDLNSLKQKVTDQLGALKSKKARQCEAAKI